MKKFLSFVLGVAFSLTLFGFSFSDGVLDYLDNFSNDTLFGYKIMDKISVDTITDTSLTIKSPVLKDEFDDSITDYTLMYGLYPLSEMLDDPSLMSTSYEKNFNNLDIEGDSDFIMQLDTADNIDSNKIYYVVSVPKDDAGTVGQISNELCFRLVDKVSGKGDECKNSTFINSSHAAGADMSLANISHTMNGNTVTLRWVSIGGSDSIDIFLRDEDAGTFHKLSTVSMGDQSYSFTVDRNGEYIVKFIPDNGGSDINYTFNADGIDGGVTPTTVTPVVVGPKENIIAILIATILIYVVYRVAKRKA